MGQNMCRKRLRGKEAGERQAKAFVSKGKQRERERGRERERDVIERGFAGNQQREEKCYLKEERYGEGHNLDKKRKF
jgi:hypothetical protein